MQKRLSPLYSLLLTTGLLLSSMLCLPSQADVVRLNDQSKPLYGKILSVTDDLIVLEAENGSRIPIARKSVAAIEFNPSTELKAPIPEKPTTSAQPLPTAPRLPQTAPATMVSSTADTKSINALMYSPIVPLLSFPNEKGEINDKQFVTLCKFKGHKSQKQYAGLYNFTNKGTFWIKLPQPQSRTADLQFTLFGKHGILEKETHPPEDFAVQARFLAENGNLIEQSPVASFSGNRAQMVEWLYLLEGMSGISGKEEVSWRVPEKTKTIELRVISSADSSRHLVGYISQLTLVSPE